MRARFKGVNITMAFDLFTDSSSESLSTNEEAIFQFVDKVEHPLLFQIKEQFYGDPKFDYEQANQLVHELIRIRNLVIADGSLRYLETAVTKLQFFFSQAYLSKKKVWCESD